MNHNIDINKIERYQRILIMLRALLILLGFFFVGLFLTGAISSLLINKFVSEQRTQLLLMSLVQNIFAFILPAFLTIKFAYRLSNPMQILGINERSYGSQYVGAFLFYLVGLAAMNQIVYWNANITFPESMQSLWLKLKEMEDLNASFANSILSDGSVGGLINSILVVGILTGFSEELFFRGALQTIFTKGGWNHHLAIWVTAFIFSAIHFQFFGFFPRLLLGAWFGYLFYWTRSIWVSAATHALNNSMVAFVAWLSASGATNYDFNDFGVTPSGFPFFALGSALIFSGMLWLLKKFLFKPHFDVKN